MNPGIPGARGWSKPAGPIDPDVCVLSVQTADGKPLACWRTTRSTTSAATRPSRPITSARSPIASSSSSPPDAKGFVGIMSNGTSGDVNNINFGKPGHQVGPGERIKVVADDVAKTVAEAYTKIEHRSDVTLAGGGEGSEARRAQADREGPRAGAGDPGEQKDKKVLAGTPSRSTPARRCCSRSTRDTVPVTLQALRIGDLGIVRDPVRGVHGDRPGDQEEEPAARPRSRSSWRTVTTATCRRRRSTRSAATRRGGRGRATWKWTRRRRSWRR